MWEMLGKGCHNPRLDLDNVYCDHTVTDPNEGSFCAPENANIDFPPLGVWTRIGVHYYSNHGLSYDVHPTVKVFCDGALSAELGPIGFYDPETPVTFAAADGGLRFWLVADVIFLKDECFKGCIVQPLYSDKATKTPFLTISDVAESTFGPPYPPVPTP